MGKLRFGRALWNGAAVNWGIALFDYCFRVPGELIGCGS
jgi:uncharacterized protein (DUF486 family)